MDYAPPDADHSWGHVIPSWRNALQNAMREDLLTRTVAALVRAPQPAARELTPWSVDDAVTFLGAAAGHPLHAAFVLVITLGLRRGEILGLGWDQVDLEQGTVRVRRQLQRVAGELRLGDVKTRRSGRVVPLPDLCVRALRRRKADQAAERLATGVHPRTVMSILGHSQIAVTMNVYTHVTTEDPRTAFGLLGGLLDRVPGQEEVARSRQTQPSEPDLEQLAGVVE